jgi:RNA polymerase sigma factor (sigma-70 family)
MNVSTFGHLHTVFAGGTVAGMSDGLLLERFVAARDGRAFEAIVARHGPLVLGVCRRMLGDRSDVEDAFQATFLILVRKAGLLRDRERLGPWLYGVAHRVATRARAQRTSRRHHERRAGGNASVEPTADLERRELLAMLDDEVTRLPERYRAVLVLCDLEDHTHEEAARELGCPLGTVKSRLDGARKRLRSRLLARGVAPSAVALPAGLRPGAASAAVPERLLALTVESALRSVASRATAAGAVSASVATLTEGVLTTMFLSRLKTLGAILLAAGTCAAGLGVVAQTPSEPKEQKPFDPQRLQIQLMIEARQREEGLRKELQDRTAAELEKVGAKLKRDVVTVNLVATKVTDHELSWLSVFPNLQTLYLHHTKIGDAGVANLRGLKGLTTLDLFDTRVTDAGLEHLAEWMPHLEWLELTDTQVTDAGLSFLKGLKHLRHVDVRRTKVTGAGVEDLRRALPGAEILHGNQH